jgi:hypothetical protein
MAVGPGSTYSTLTGERRDASARASSSTRHWRQVSMVDGSSQRYQPRSNSSGVSRLPTVSSTSRAPVQSRSRRPAVSRRVPGPSTSCTVPWEAAMMPSGRSPRRDRRQNCGRASTDGRSPDRPLHPTDNASRSRRSRGNGPALCDEHRWHRHPPGGERSGRPRSGRLVAGRAMAGGCGQSGWRAALVQDPCRRRDVCAARGRILHRSDVVAERTVSRLFRRRCRNNLSGKGR